MSPIEKSKMSGIEVSQRYNVALANVNSSYIFGILFVIISYSYGR